MSKNGGENILKSNILDRVVGFIAPTWSLNRTRSRAAIQYLSDQGLIGPGSTKRSMRGWGPVALSADTDIIPKMGNLRAGSRDMFYNIAIARAAIKRPQINAVGSGLKLQSRIDREFIGLTDDQADKWQRNTEREFDSWASSPECDAARTLNFYDQTSLAFISMLMSGDVFVAFPFIPRPNMEYDLRIKLIEADFCSNPRGAMNTHRISGGVEIDENDAPVKYWFRKPNNLDQLNFGSLYSDKWVDVPAYNSFGMRQVLHLFDKERPGQRRGIPLLAPIIETLKQLARYKKASIDAAVVNALFTVFIKHISQGGALKDGYVAPGMMNTAPTDQKVTADDYGASDELYEMGTGNVIDMLDGEEIQVADPKHPVSSFDKFVTEYTKELGAALGIPYEVLTLHFASSYSAARAALNEAWKFFMSRRTYMARYFCQPVFEWFLTEAVMNGRISAPGFFSDPAIRHAYMKAAWIGPGRGMIEPLREIKAAKEAIDGKLSNHETEFTKIYGDDWEGAMNKLSREEKFLNEKGLKGTAAAEDPDPETTTGPDTDTVDQGN